MSSDEQDYWLEWAETNHATRDELRAELRNRRLITSRPVDEVALENDYQHARIRRLERELAEAECRADSAEATRAICPNCGGRLVCEGCGQ